MFTKTKNTGLFFWKKKKTIDQKAEEIIAAAIKYLPQIKKLLKHSDSDFDSDGNLIGRMYDYYADYGRTTSSFNFGDNSITANLSPMEIDAGGKSPDKRQEMKPVDVVNELETVPIPFTLQGLDEKISLFTDKSKISTQRYAKAQIEGFLKRLQNRKKYAANAEFYHYFPNTTDDKIDSLLEKYKLVMKESELFVPTFPAEAIAVMKKYTEVTEAISGQKPVFYVIAEDKDFEKKFKKLDPILLVQSPFGFYWQILGAWDKEMLLLSEL